MKIKKLREAAEENKNILADGKVDAGEVKDAIETDTNDKKTLDDNSAKKVADEINKVADETGAESAVINPSDAWDEKNVPIRTKNRLVSILDLSYYHALRNRSLKTFSGVNVLVEGLPGGGKTGIIVDWTKFRGLNLFEINVKSDKIDQMINGLPMRDITTPDENRLEVIPSNTLIQLMDTPNSVLFLDEYNRQTNTKLRASLLTLINEHKVVVGNKTFKFDKLLFVICAINPSVKEDLGAVQLNGAELSRFPWYVSNFDSDPHETHEYLNTSTTRALGRLLQRKGKKLKANNKIVGDWEKQDDKDLPPVDFGKLVDQIQAMSDEEREKYFVDKGLIEIVREMELANAILQTPNFRFDSKIDLKDLWREQATIFNKRLLTDAILSTDGNPDLFLYWVEHSSNLLQRNKDILKDAVTTYKTTEKSDEEIQAEIMDMVDGDASDLFAAAVSGNEEEVTDEVGAAIDNILDDEGIDDSDIDPDDLGTEDDDDMFGGSDDDIESIENEFKKYFK